MVSALSRIHGSMQTGKTKISELHKAFFEGLKVKLGYKSMDDWYKINQGDIFKNGGKWLLAEHYNDSPTKALLSVYPEHNWILERFKNKPKGHWKSEQNRRSYFDWLGIQLGYKDMNEWYQITAQDIHQNGGAGLLL